MAVERGLARVERAAARRLRLASLPLDLQLGWCVARLRREVRIGADEEERRGEEDGCGSHGPPAAQRVSERDEPDRQRRDRGARVGEQQPDREQGRQRRQPARTPPRGGEQDRDEQHVRGRERAEERRDEPAQRVLVARVVEPVLRQPGEALAVVETELLAEPSGDSGVAPGLERDRVDVDEPPRGDDPRGGEDRVTEPAPVVVAERDPAAEEVRRDGSQVVADAVEDSVRGRVAAEPVLGMTA